MAATATGFAMSCERVSMFGTRLILILVLVSSCDVGTQAQPSPVERVPTSNRPEVLEQVTKYVAANAIPLETVEADDALVDLLPLREMIGDARIVALGEATHGTHEFFTVKHRLVKFLVTELGFTDFALEASLTDAAEIDEYVRRGTGDPGRALDMGFTVWNTEEMVDLVEWMRSHNVSAPRGQQLRFWGFDMQDPQTSMEQVLTHIRQALPSEFEQLKAHYRCFELLGGFGYEEVPDPTQDQCRVGVEAASAWIEENRDNLMSSSSEEQYDWTARNARLVVQAESMGSAADFESGNQLRDQFMAENVEWMLEQAGPDAKFMLWAHNDHVARSGESGKKPLGAYLANNLSTDLVVIGFEFSVGSLTSLMPTAQGLKATAVKLAPPQIDSYADAFERAALENFVLDLRDLPTGEAGDWLRAKHPVRSIGFQYDPARDVDTIELASLPLRFDLVIYLRETSPSRVRSTAAP
jgi:erythromycin esterase